ncbi:hypothetical protein FACS1894172_09430 [Spirochaetia bacterium]|nr:hypothetical protein FACS1894172_09430 [Spirochaetia bacterium]
MNALSGETWTAKQLAERFNVTSATINNHARVLFGKVPSGHHRHFDEAQVTMILESIKNATSDDPRVTKRKEVLSSLETELTPVLQLKMLAEQKEKLHQQEIEIYRAENARLKAEAAEKDKRIATQALKLDDLHWEHRVDNRVIEALGGMRSDRDDIDSMYGRYR